MMKQARSVAISRSGSGSDNGVALLITVLILFVVSLLGATVVSLGSVDFALSGNYRASTVAFHLAESGLETAAADLRVDFLDDPTDNWLRDWIDMSGAVPTVVSPFPDPTMTDIDGQALSEVTLAPNPYAGTPYRIGSVSGLGNGSYERFVWLPPQIVSAAGTPNVEFRVRAVGTDSNPATPSRVTVDAIVNVALDPGGSSGAGMYIGSPDNSGDAIQGRRITLAGPVLVTGDGGTRFRLRNRSRMINNYEDIDHPTRGLGALAAKLPPLEGVDVGGETVESVGAVLRLKDARLQVTGQATVGTPNNPGDAFKETIDGFFTDDPPNGNPDIYADVSGGYDLDDSVTFPSLYNPYVDPNGTAYATFEAYLDSIAYTPGLAGDLVIDGDTASFSYTDPGGKGSISWNAATQVLTIDGIIKINGQAKLGKTGEWEGDDDDEDGVIGAVKYAGTGTIWATDKIEVNTDVYPVGLYLQDGPDADTSVDGDLALVASKAIEIQSGWDDPNVRILASLFAEEKIDVKEPANIAGSIATGFLEGQGNDAINIWYVPMLATVSPYGSAVAGSELSIEVSVRDWFQRR